MSEQWSCPHCKDKDAEIARLRAELDQVRLERHIMCKDNARLRAELDAEREKQRWIPVGERLPEDNERVEFWDDEPSLSTGTHVKQEPQWWSDDGCSYYGYAYKHVTHWRPLPEPPEEQQENTTITISGDVPRGKPLTYFGDEEQQL